MANGVKPILVDSLEKSIAYWLGFYSDVVEGKDIRLYQEFATRSYAPHLLGLRADGATAEPVLALDEKVIASWPVFVDDDPLPTPAPPGGKVKAHGKWACGLIVLTDRSFALAGDEELGRRRVLSWPRERIRAVNQLRFAFSKLSMTSAGDGYEILIDGCAETPRILLRIAVNAEAISLPALLTADV